MRLARVDKTFLSSRPHHHRVILKARLWRLKDLNRNARRPNRVSGFFPAPRFISSPKTFLMFCNIIPALL